MERGCSHRHRRLKQGSRGLFPAQPTQLRILLRRWCLSWVWRREGDGRQPHVPVGETLTQGQGLDEQPLTGGIYLPPSPLAIGCVVLFPCI